MTSPAPTPPSASTWFLTCIAGPDQGKRAALGAESLTVGRTAECNILSDDPDVPAQFAMLTLRTGRLYVHALSSSQQPFVDGHPVADAGMSPGQQIRFGRSLWLLQGPVGAGGVFDFVRGLGEHVSAAAGIEQPGEWNAREMFSDVAKRHSDEEVEAYFTVGTASTTPALTAIDAQWPHPWIFARVFAVTALLYAGFLYAWLQFDNSNLIPGLIMIGSTAVPLSLLIFFFEVNVTRNVSLYQVIKLLLIGGLVGIVVSLIGFQLTGLESWLGAAAAGIIEEIGKATALLLVVRRLRFRWTLNGLLLGATIGTGFAIFESAGYALNAGLGAGGGDAMRSLIIERGLLSMLGGHVLWTGLVGAALWRVRGNQPFRWDMVTDPRFVRVLLICVAMHMIWDAPWYPPLDLKYLLLGAVAWLLVLGFIQAGLKQVREAQITEVTAARQAALA